MTRRCWYRIDADTLQITAVDNVAVLRASGGKVALIETGRFMTDNGAAVYATGDKITDEEWRRGAIAPPSCGL